MLGLNQSQQSNSNSNFINYLNDLEDEINETRKELNFCKKEVFILKTEENTVAEMAQAKMVDIDKYLNKEIHYLEELINKAKIKQKAENSRFAH